MNQMKTCSFKEFSLDLKADLASEYESIFKDAGITGSTTGLIAGRLFRSHLAYSMSSLTNKELLKQACLALELAHTATLIHDDIIDRATTRRGHPSVLTIFGSDVALLLGNLITERAHTVAQRTSSKYAELMSLALFNVNRAQMLELLSREDTGRTVSDYLDVCLGKTSAMLRLGFYAGLTSDNIELLRFPGLADAVEQIGIAFQILDDCEDFEISMTGKEFRSKHGTQDIDLANYTLPLILAHNDGFDITKARNISSWETYISQAMAIGVSCAEKAQSSIVSMKVSDSIDTEVRERIANWINWASSALISNRLDKTLQEIARER